MVCKTRLPEPPYGVVVHHAALLHEEAAQAPVHLADVHEDENEPRGEDVHLFRPAFHGGVATSPEL